MTSTIQGIGIVSTTKNFVLLKDIVTNPQNIRSSVNTITAEKLHGVGTSIIAHIAKICLSEGKEGVFLSSLKEAEGFYERCGFENLFLDEDVLRSMFISAKKLQTPEISSSLFRAGASLTPTESTGKPSPCTSSDAIENGPEELAPESAQWPEAPCLPTKADQHEEPSYSPLQVSTRQGTRKIMIEIVSKWEKRCHFFLQGTESPVRMIAIVPSLTISLPSL